jgi:hypothetical protein
MRLELKVVTPPRADGKRGTLMRRRDRDIALCRDQSKAVDTGRSHRGTLMGDLARNSLVHLLSVHKKLSEGPDPRTPRSMPAKSAELFSKRARRAGSPRSTREARFLNASPARAFPAATCRKPLLAHRTPESIKWVPQATSRLRPIATVAQRVFLKGRLYVFHSHGQPPEPRPRLHAA